MPTIEELLKSRPIEDPYQRAMLGIMYTGHWFVMMINTVLKPYGVTEPQYNVLRILRGRQGAPISINSIQDRMVQPSSNVSRIVDKLVEKGSVSRRICPSNKRRVDILITPCGLKLLEEIEPVLQRHNDAMRKAIPVDDAICVSRFLDALRDLEKTSL